jgi:8-oxo-dGTP diphosphatase
MRDHADGPTFGRPEPGATYLTRPGAYGIALDGNGHVLVVDTATRLALPGGGLDPGESEEAGLAREILEETGRRSTPLRLVGRCNLYVFAPDYGAYFFKTCAYYLVSVSDEVRPGAEHSTLWLPFATACDLMTDESDRWALREALPLGGTVPLR